METNKVLQVALDEMKQAQYEEAAKHFDMVVIESGAHPEASFFRAYCKCHIGTLGDIPNKASIFTNAFFAYVDSIKTLCDTNEKEAKMTVAIEKLSELVSYFSGNASRTWFAPSIGMNISRATKIMTDACVCAIKTSGIKVDSVTLEKINNASKDNNKIKKLLIGILVAGAVAFIIYEVVTWSAIL